MIFQHLEREEISISTDQSQARGTTSEKTLCLERELPRCVIKIASIHLKLDRW